MWIFWVFSFLQLAQGLRFELEALPHGNRRCVYQTFAKDLAVSGKVRISGDANQRIDVAVSLCVY